MSPRRARGVLEAEVLRLLWDADDDLTASAVRNALAASGTPLAQTTVLTVLTRLITKGSVRRDPTGRRYRATESEAATAAASMAGALAAVTDRDAALRRFAGALSTADLDLLRRSLGSD